MLKIIFPLRLYILIVLFHPCAIFRKKKKKKAWFSK